MIVLQGSMPDKCKRCKESGGLEDGLHLIHTEEDYVNFYCDGQSPETCPIKGEIPNEHGRLGDLDSFKESLKDVRLERPIKNNGTEIIELGELFAQFIDNAPTVIPASEGTD